MYVCVDVMVGWWGGGFLDKYTDLVNASFGGEVLEVAIVHARFFLTHGGVDEGGGE